MGKQYVGQAIVGKEYVGPIIVGKQCFGRARGRLWANNALGGQASARIRRVDNRGLPTFSADDRGQYFERTIVGKQYLGQMIVGKD